MRTNKNGVLFKLRLMLTFIICTFLFSCKISALEPETSGTGKGKIVFERSSNIWVMNADSSDQRQLNSGGASAGPSWSSDGSKIIYNKSGDGVYMMNADGTNLKKITGSYANPSLSPDGMKIIFNDSLVNIWIINTDGTNLRLVAPGNNPSWSPDGTKIVYDFGEAIRVMNSDGTNTLRLTSGPGDTQPKWSPDGSKIVYANNINGIYVMNAAGSNRRLLTTSGCINPSWSPDGTKIIYANGSGNIWVMNADGTNKRQITFISSDAAPAWCPAQ